MLLHYQLEFRKEQDLFKKRTYVIYQLLQAK